MTVTLQHEDLVDRTGEMPGETVREVRRHIIARSILRPLGA